MKSKYPTVSIILLIIITHSFSVSKFIYSQTISGHYDKKLDGTKLDSLFSLLEKGSFKDIPRYFFDRTYDDELPDLIMFINETPSPKTPDVKIELLKGDKKRKELFGERYLYVMAFWAKQDADTSRFFNSDSTTFILTALDQKMSSGEFAVFTVLRFIAAAFTKQALESGSKTEFYEQIQRKVKIIEIGSLADSKLYYIFCRLPLHENTINRVHVGENDKSNVCLTTFGNYSPSWITTSIGFLMSLPSSDREKEKKAVYPIVEPFLFGHLYLKRPQLPRPRLNDGCKEWKRQISISSVIGTQISDKLMEDIFVGASLGHVLDKLSFVIGINFRTALNGDVKKRFRYISCGITFIL